MASGSVAFATSCISGKLVLELELALFLENDLERERASVQGDEVRTREMVVRGRPVENRTEGSANYL